MRRSFRASQKVLVAILVLAAASVFGGPSAHAETGAVSASTFQDCTPPGPGTFYTSLRVLGTSCKTGRQVVTHMTCLNPPICDSLRHKKWHCHVKGGIAFRTTKCRRAGDRIVATAAGD